jgi:hypothetical protein
MTVFMAVLLQELDSQQLANLSPEEQKMALGEQLYHRVFDKQPELAGKITGACLKGEGAVVVVVVVVVMMMMMIVMVMMVMMVMVMMTTTRITPTVMGATG